MQNEEYEEDVFENDLDDNQVQDDTQQQTPATEPMVPMSQVMQFLSQNQPAPAPTPPAPAPTMSDAERRAYLRQLEVDDTLVGGFVQAFTPGENGIDPANVKRAVETLVQGVRAETLRALELTRDGMSHQIGQELGEVQHFVTEQKRASTWNEFATAFPQLQNFRQLVDAKAEQLGPMMPRGTSRAQAFAYVANAVAQDLNAMGIQLKPQQARRSAAAPQNVFQNNQQFPGLPQAPTMGSLPMGLGVGAAPRKRGSDNPYYDSETFGPKK